MVYLGQPYSHQDPAVRQWRFEAACRATAALMRAGLVVFSPVAHSHPLTRYGLPGDWRFWERYDRAFLEACGALAILTLDGWKESVGVGAEIRIAFELGLPVFLIDPARVGIRAENAPAAWTGALEVTR
jgi:hypothetical protein